MRNIALYIGFLTIFIPQFAFAQTIACSSQGYTVVFVNGVFDTKQQADVDKNALQDKLGLSFNSQPLVVYTGYNPTHLAGAGDLAQSLAQTFSYSVSDYDLQTILMQIYPEVTTRKLLIVGHSQGAYYANEMYSYLLAHGEPKEAVGIYEVGTPAPKAAGGGKYLNSSSDLLLTYLHDVLHFGTLPTNIFIPLSGADIKSPWPGHSFTDAYLAGASDRIVSDISGELSALQPTYSADTGGCFTPPDSTLGYKTQRAIFSIADPAASIIKTGTIEGFNGVIAIGNTVLNGATTAFNFLSNALPTFSANITDDSHTEKNFTVMKKLYGSSLDTDDVKNLLGDSQGGAVALAFPKEKPIAIGGGFVEGTSTGPDSGATEIAVPTTTTPIFVPGASTPTQDGMGGSASAAVIDPQTDDSTPGASDTTDATTTEPEATTTEDVVPPEQTITPPTPPAIAINEIEWAGDQINSGREWIELKNLSSQSIDLSNLVIVAKEGGSQYIPLSGTIEPSGFFLIQRDPLAPLNPATNVAFDFSKVLNITSFEQLNDSGEQLALVEIGDWGTTTVDITPSVSACSGWCAGSAAANSGLGATLSMERIDATAPGESASNWANNDTYTASANMPGGDGQSLYATVLAENSQHISQDFGWFCSPENTPIASGQEYHVAQSTQCTYLARFVPWRTNIMSGLFKGTVGSSTVVSMHNSWIGTAAQFEEGIDPASAEPGDQYFAALWTVRTDSFPQPLDNITFPIYFTTGHTLERDGFDGPLVDKGDTNPPSDNFRVVPFVYQP